MRPLRLQIEAFGSYAGCEAVDFEALGQLGLFLVTGPTGSGKTTIFDALVFALYGTVPGDRRAEEVHSHHAGPGTTPRVLLELEADGTRWKIERTAKHERPVRRGEGTTTEQPTAAMWRWQGGDWAAVASGQREVTGAVVDRIGLTAEQFQRVVLLPQGDFEQFLVARSDERKVLLRQLFGTEVFEQAVDHLRRASSVARAAADAASARHHQHLDALVHHLEQAELLTGSLVFGDAPATERVARLERSLVDADQARDRAAAIAAAADHDLAAAEAVASRWALREQRREERDRLAAGRADHEAALAALDAARRARPVRDLAAPARRHREAAAAAAAVAATGRGALAEVLELLGLPPLPRIDGAVATCRRAFGDEVEGWRRLADRWRALAVADDARAAAEAGAAARAAAVDRAEAALASAGTATVAIEQAWGHAREAASGLAAARAEAERTDRHHVAAADLDRAVADLRDAVAAAAAADAVHRDAFDRYLQHAAPRLAAELRPDEPCPVCGALEHPHPAVGDPDAPAVSAAGLDRLRAAAGDAARRRDELAGQVGRRRAELGDLADLPTSTLAARAAVAADAVAAAERAAAAAAAAERELDAARAVVDARRTEVAEAGAALAVARAELDRCRQQQAAVAAELDDAPAADVVAARLQLLDRGVALLDALQGADDAASSAQLVAATSGDALAAAVTAGGWADAEEALAAALGDREVDRLAHRVDQWDRAWQAVVAQLAADDAELPDEAPSVSALAAFAAAAAATRAATVERHTSLGVHVDLARRALEQLDGASSSAAAALREAELAATVYERCAGQLAPKVSLESWVLGAELDRVVDAANGHLEEMTAGRYRLARVTDTTDARVSTGLDLVVDDAYTGTSRRTTSLSGGERFQASLALALGLADVVTAGVTATARTLDALFVDEGFGSLDAAALDQAIATLDRLRVHGRQIGVITHVEAMQAALPIGIRVERLPGEAGSRIVQPALDVLTDR